MNYEEYITDIQQAAKEYLSTGNIIFGILLLIGIIAGLLFFFIYVRKEYYRKRSEIDTFLIEDKQKTDIELTQKFWTKPLNKFLVPVKV